MTARIFLQGCEADSLGLVPKLHSWHEIGENKLVAMSFGEVLQSTEPLSSLAKSGFESRQSTESTGRAITTQVA